MRDNVHSFANRADDLVRSRAFRLAGRVFDLVQAQQTPPVPIVYAVWYAYAEGSIPGLVRDIDTRLARGETFSVYDLESLFARYLEPDSDGCAQLTLSSVMEESLGSMSRLIEESTTNGASFRDALSDAEGQLQKTSDAGTLGTIVTRLFEESRKMTYVTSQLFDGLSRSRLEIYRLSRELETLQDLSRTDPLTGVSNRRAFDARIDKEIAKIGACGGALCLALADIDHFKCVNDRFGHQAGDEILKAFACLLKMRAGPEGMVARYGGEEFAMILPGLSIVQANNLLVAVNREFSEQSFEANNGLEKIGPVTFSVGISRYRPGRAAGEMIARADGLLFEAKNAGRNRVRAEM